MWVIGSCLFTLMRYSLTGLLLVSRGGAQESFTVREEKLITSGLPGVLGTSEKIKILVSYQSHSKSRLSTDVKDKVLIENVSG